MPQLKMASGFTLATGSITSTPLNWIIQRASSRQGVPFQLDVRGRDTGTDAMAGVLSAQDVAATSIGIPIRNMHTISETGNTSDVLAAIYGIYYALVDMEDMISKGSDLRQHFCCHPRLDLAKWSTFVVTKQ